MTDVNKLSNLKILLGINTTDEDAQLGVYLEMAKDEIMNWLYSSVGGSEGNPFPEKYDWVQISACIAGFNLSGAENQMTHSENGISRTFKYSDMVDYIHAHVYPYVGIPE